MKISVPFLCGLFRSEETVARISQTWENVTVFVEASVERRDVDLYVRMRFGNVGNALGRTDDAHEFNIFASAIL